MLNSNVELYHLLKSFILKHLNIHYICNMTDINY